jgi:hypothetical protein
MAFKRWGYTFDGAYASPSQLEAGAGIYLVWCRMGERWSVIDVGEAEPRAEELLGAELPWWRAPVCRVLHAWRTSVRPHRG